MIRAADDRRTAAETVFECAARVFDGWTDAETGLRVLRVITAATSEPAGFGGEYLFSTPYHQLPPFLEGGRKVLIHGRAPDAQTRFDRKSCLVDLATGEFSSPFPERHYPCEFHDKANTGLFLRRREGTEEWIAEVVIYDLTAGRELASYAQPGWTFQESHLLADGRTAAIAHYQGKFYDEPVRSQFHLLRADGTVTPLLDEQDYFCNHIQGCPADPTLYAYNKWPSPRRRAPIVLHLARTDGSMNHMAPLDAHGIAAGPHWGGQRDHYVWQPDGRRIASYFMPDETDQTDHFYYGWWVSVLDWRTGEDIAVKYPDERWGCNFTVSPDSRYIVTAGGHHFQYIYLIDIDGLRQGWNETPLCRYPASVESGANRGPFHWPFPLPDQSGVIFRAGYPGAADGIYLVEWPEGMR